VFRKEINGQASSTRRVWAPDVSTISTVALGVVDTEQKLRTDPGSLEYLRTFGYPDIDKLVVKLTLKDQSYGS
jgi:hypothetical protein